MPFADNLESGQPQQSFQRNVPVVRGDFYPSLSNTFIGPLPDPTQESMLVPEKPTRRMWVRAGAIALASSLVCAGAFAQSNHAVESVPPPGCKVVAVHETAVNHVEIQLDRSAGNEKVWIGEDDHVMEAHPVPGNPTQYSVGMGGYFHGEIIAARVGFAMCDNQFNLGSTSPGDEKFFPVTSQ